MAKQQRTDDGLEMFRVINGGLWGLMVVYSDYSKL